MSSRAFRLFNPWEFLGDGVNVHLAQVPDVPERKPKTNQNHNAFG